MHPYLILLIIVLFIKSLLMIGVILFAGIGLGPDEAQYWTWSQYLDWGYYSKPPGVAWQIWLGTQLFGNTELGVRFFSIVIAFLLCIAVYFLAIACRCRPQTAFWAGVVMAVAPLGVMGSLFAITDPGMVLFWTLCCIVMADALYQRQRPNYYLIGLLVMVGALFKWPIYLFWAVVLVTCFFYRFLISKHIMGGIGISLLGLLPSVVWNIQHNWVTFRHVASTVTGETVAKGNFLEFLGSQALLLSPILFLLLLISGVYLVVKRDQIPAPLIFCGTSSLTIILIFSVVSLFKKIQGNWCDFAYPSGIVFLCWYACEQISWGCIVLKFGIVLSVLLSLFGLSVPYVQSHALFTRIPYPVNPFRHNMGWEKLSSLLEEAGYNPHEHFLFGDKYQTSSILSFYGQGQKRAYFLNLHGIRKNQFSFWPSMADEQMGKTGFFILPENSPHLEKDPDLRVAFYKGALSQYFKKVEFVGMKPLFFNHGTPVKGVFIFKGEGYNGLQPVNSIEHF